MTKYSIAREIYDLIKKQGVCEYIGPGEDEEGLDSVGFDGMFDLIKLTDGILALLENRVCGADLTLHGVRVHQTTLGVPEDFIVCHPYVVRELLKSPTLRFGTDICLTKQV